MEVSHSLSSSSLGYPKQLWIFHSERNLPANRLLVFLDAEIYLQRVGARDQVQPLIDAPGQDATCVVFVSHGTEGQRMSESLFNRKFSSFLCDELLAFLRAQKFVAPNAVASLCGLSLTGLATVMAAVHYPGVYQKIAAQSGAYWPEEGRVLRELEALPTGIRQAFYFDVGSEETDREGEVMSQKEGVEAVGQVLEQKGYAVSQHIFPGGHAIEGWSAALPQYLDWAMKAGA